MNILFVAPNYYPHIGGVEKHIKEVSEELAKDGHEIVILTLKHENSYKSHEKTGNIEIIRMNRLDIRKLGVIYLYLQLFLNLPKFLTADIIHFHDFWTLWEWGKPFLSIFRFFKKPIYLTFHGWEGDIPPKPDIIEKRKICEQLVDGNICIGHFIEKWYNTKADIVSYGGVHKAEETTECENYILFAGRLAQDTGIIAYMQAWKEINKIYPELKFIICGDGDLKQKLVDYISKANITNVEFKGFVQDPEDYVKKSKIVFASGFLSILEAFSYKKPVISFYDNELKKDYLEMMPDSEKMMWISKSKEEIILYIQEALEDNEKVQKAYEYSLENSWQKVKEDYYKLWKKI